LAKSRRPTGIRIGVITHMVYLLKKLVYQLLPLDFLVLFDYNTNGIKAISNEIN
jgi:hypothetical protein